MMNHAYAITRHDQPAYGRTKHELPSFIHSKDMKEYTKLKIGLIWGG